MTMELHFNDSYDYHDSTNPDHFPTLSKNTTYVHDISVLPDSN